MYLVVLKNINGDKIYGNILKKQENKIKLNKKDIADISLLPLFYSKDCEEEVVYRIAKLLSNLELNEGNLKLDKDDLNYLSFNLNLYIEKFVKSPEILKKIHGEVNMMEHLEDMIVEIEERLISESEERGKEIGKEIGKENKGIEVAKTMLESNYDKKEILRISKISEKQFNQLQ